MGLVVTKGRRGHQQEVLRCYRLGHLVVKEIGLARFDRERQKRHPVIFFSRRSMLSCASFYIFNETLFRKCA